MPDVQFPQPCQGIAFLDQVEIANEPWALLARYFLAANAALEAKGLTLRRVPFETLKATYVETSESWGGLIPFFDCDINPIPDDNAACFIAFNQADEPVSTCAMRVFDFTGTNAKEEIESQRMFYGVRAPERAGINACTLSGDLAQHLSGHALYAGAYWVRRDYRGMGIGHLVPHMTRYYALARWPVEYKITFGGPAFLTPEIRELYQYEDHNGEFTFTENGKLVYRGLFLWARRSFMLDRLPGLLERLDVPSRTTRDSGAEKQSV